MVYFYGPQCRPMFVLMCVLVCPAACHDRGCFTGNDGHIRCCDRKCIGGCNGATPSDCFVCRHVTYHGRCHAHCPPGLYEVSWMGQLESNAGGGRDIVITPPIATRTNRTAAMGIRPKLTLHQSTIGKKLSLNFTLKSILKLKRTCYF